MPLPESLGGYVRRPTALSSGPDRLDVFAIRLDVGGIRDSQQTWVHAIWERLVFLANPFAGTLEHWWWDGTNWSGPVSPSAWSGLSGWRGLLGQDDRKVQWVSAVSSGPDRLDVFGALVKSGDLDHWWRGATEWTRDEVQGPFNKTSVVEGVSALSWGPGRVDVFGVNLANGQLLQWWWENGIQQGPPKSLGGNLQRSPSAVSSGPNRLDVFAVDAGQALQWWWGDGTVFTGPMPLGGLQEALYSSPCSASWGPGRVDVFAAGVLHEGETPRLLHWSSDDGVQWDGATPLDGGAVHQPCAVSRGPNQLDVFAIDVHGFPQHWWWDGTQMAGPAPLGGEASSTDVELSVASWAPGRLDLFGISTDNSLLHWWWPGST